MAAAMAVVVVVAGIETPVVIPHPTGEYLMNVFSLRLIVAFVIVVIATPCSRSPTAFAQEKAISDSPISGIDKSLFGDGVSAGDNFYLYANQNWLQSTTIPNDKSNYGIFTLLNDKTQEQVRALIEQAAQQDSQPGSAAQKVGDLYGSVMDIESRNQSGIAPIEKLLALIEAIDSKRSAAKVFGTLCRSGVYGPIVPYVSVDARDSDRYTVYLTQSGLTLPDRDYYVDDLPRYVELRGKLKLYIAGMLSELGIAEPAEAAEAIFVIESKIAESHWTKTKNRDPEKTYNKNNDSQIVELIDGFPWKPFAKGSGIAGRQAYVVRQPSYVSAMGQLFEATDLDDWKSYLRFRLVDAYAEGLSEQIERRHFDFHSGVISGVADQEELWKRAVNRTGGSLGELVGQLYVEKHFRPEAKERMSELVENLKRAFAARIETRDWMSEGTKQQAFKKLSMFTTKIGYPDEWKDYSKLSIVPSSLVVNLIASERFEYARDLGKLDGPIDRGEWHMTPQTINAYYSPTMNEIVFPAAILQPPFFNMSADDAANYGAIGAVIGHELSHGFDDKGSKYDGKGNLRNWWTEGDRAEFERRADGLVQQYDQFEPVAGNHVNGELTLGENIGDLGGLNVALEAYHLSLGGREAPVIDGLTGDQRFFLGWAQIWRRLYLEPELLKRLVTDPHSPSEYRVNGIVRNMDAWYKAFGIQAGDQLHLKPEDRVRIW